MPRPSPLLMVLGAVGLGCVLDGVAKDASREASVLVLTAGRYAFGALVLSAGFVLGRRRWPGPESWRFHAGRGVAVATAALSFFAAVHLLPLAVATTLGFTAVLMVAPLGWAILGERPSGFAFVAAVVGLAGAGLAASGTEGAAGGSVVAGTAAALLAAFAYALALVLVRLRTRAEDPATILLLANVVPAGLLVPVAAMAVTVGAVRAPSPGVVPDASLMGVLGVSIWWLMTQAYASAPAWRLAPLEYVALPISAALGYVWFGEVPGWRAWAGAAVIVAACLAVALEERLRTPRAAATLDV